MVKFFISFGDNAMISTQLASQPELVHLLRCTTKELLSLAKLGKVDLTHDDYLTRAERFLSTTPQYAPNNSTEVALSDEAQSALEFKQYCTDNPTTLDVGHAEDLKDHDGHNTRHDVMIYDSELDNSPDHNPSYGLSQTEISLHTDSSYTYSFQEKQFGRRLHRFCLEWLYHLLSQPNPDPNIFHRIFALTSQDVNKVQMASLFQGLLRRGVKESLEDLSFQFLTIGGAGTHYPRRDQHENIGYPNQALPESVHEYIPRLEAETFLGNNLQESLESRDLSGIWFDPYDVDGFLRERGIFLDGDSSFAELPPSIVSHILRSSADYSDLTPNSVQSWNLIDTPAANTWEKDFWKLVSLDQRGTKQSGNHGQLPAVSAKTVDHQVSTSLGDMPFGGNSRLGYSSQILTPKYQTVAFDIETFMESRSICLPSLLPSL
jgi:hypothetical protein